MTASGGNIIGAEVIRYQRSARWVAAPIEDTEERPQTPVQEAPSLLSVAGSLKLCDNPRLKALGYRKIHFLSHRYFMLYRLEDNLAIVDNNFHELQDDENRVR